MCSSPGISQEGVNNAEMGMLSGVLGGISPSWWRMRKEEAARATSGSSMGLEEKQLPSDFGREFRLHRAMPGCDLRALTAFPFIPSAPSPCPWLELTRSVPAPRESGAANPQNFLLRRNSIKAAACAGLAFPSFPFTLQAALQSPAADSHLFFPQVERDFEREYGKLQQ